MADPTELVLLVGLGLAIGAFVALPLCRAPRAAISVPADDEASLMRHRVAVEALRDVEADRRAGSLDDGAYAEQRAEAEARAVQTLAALEEVPSATAPRSRAAGGRAAILVAGALIGALLVGTLLPAPIGLANRTTVDAGALSTLADEYLARNTSDDLARGAALLLAVIREQPQNQSAYQRLITAYLRAEDYPDATAATDALAGFAPGSPDVPFFRGLIALRGA
ncbi:MAG: c-type cytochrome biogenesis protein CcmI, partial [Chloroflexota bacterium]|nr:c-type cytochrome biogenesis protein CcmI [Chloroflexota bacterium]